MSDTYEYAYLTLLDISELEPGERKWVGVLQSGPGTTVYGTGDSALKIMNQLGQDGWLIGDAQRLPVEGNKLPEWLVRILRQSFGQLGIVHSRETHFMTHRVQWDDTGSSPTR